MNQGLKEKRNRLNKLKAKYYIPNGKVEQFIKLVGEDKTFISLFIGGNGTGKTSAGANIVANICYGPQNKFFDYQMFKQWPYLKQGRIISDPTTLKEKIIPELKKWFPANESDRLPVANYATAKEGKNFEAKFTTNTGHTFDLMSNEQDPKEFESVDLGWIWFDEPPSEAIFKACIGRARLGMRIFMTFTPLTHSAWLKDQIVDRARDVNADYVEAGMEDNCFAEQTEILTENGWRDLDKMNVGDKVATYNLKTRIIENQRVESVIKKQYIGEMIDVGMGLLATPDHRMITFNSDRGKNRTIADMPLSIIPADKLRQGLRMLNFAEYYYKPTKFDSPFPDKISGKDWCEFMGWYIADGCSTGVKGGKRINNGVYITQTIKGEKEKLRVLLNKTGWKWHERKNDFYTYDKKLHDYLFQFGNCYTKYLPRDIFEYPKEYLIKLWKTLLITDGDTNKRYLTSSKRLADDVQELLIRLSYRTSVRKQVQGRKNIYGKKYDCCDMYCVSALDSRYYYIQKRPERKFYDGIVSCVSVKNGTIIVRDKTEKYPLITGNCKIHGSRGFLEHANILQMVNAMTEDEKQARAFGKFGHLIGRVHKKFSRKIHVIRPFPIDEKKFCVYMALDTHPRVPDHVMWLAVNSKDQKYVCAELLSEGLTRELTERIKTTERLGHYRMRDRLIDPSAYNDEQHHENKSVGSKLEELGLYFIRGSKDLAAGIKRLNDALDYQIVADEMIKAPEIFVFDTCPVTIKQLEEYVWQEWKGRGADEKKLNAKPRDKNDHMPENLHRLLIHEPFFTPYDTGNYRKEEMDDSPDPYYDPLQI